MPLAYEASNVIAEKECKYNKLITNQKQQGKLFNLFIYKNKFFLYLKAQKLLK